MSRLDDRIVERDDGSLVMLKPGHGHKLVYGMSARTGKAVQRIASTADATFSDAKAKRPSRAKPSEPSNTVCTRTEAAAILGVTQEEAAAILDRNEVMRSVAYDARHVRLLADALKSGAKAGTLDVPIGPMTQADP